jgi:hypothetical protein
MELLASPSRLAFGFWIGFRGLSYDGAPAV